MEKRKKNMFILCAASLLSAAFIINFSLFFYRSYQKELIRTEQDQLLTMARTVGQSLVSYIEQELTALDLYFEPGRSFMTDSHEQALYEAALDFLKRPWSAAKNSPPRDGIRCFSPAAFYGRTPYTISSMP